MQSLLSIDVGFDVRATGHLVRLADWQDGVRYHPEPDSCLGAAECCATTMEEMAETLVRAGYSIVIAQTPNGREVQCTPREHAPPGDADGEWDGPAWAVQARNDNYWCVRPTMEEAMKAAGWTPEQASVID